MAKTAKKKANPARKRKDAAVPGSPLRKQGDVVASGSPVRKHGDAAATATAASAPAEPAVAKPKPARAYVTAEQMARSQRNISVSEFFAKNRHLLGFDNPRKALLTAVKEAVDNSLDACEEAGILPVVEITIVQLGETLFRVVVQDNGPGIVRKEIPNIFGRLLYGSKFHRLRMSRGQQGIGISAAGMYGLLTTGQPVKITSRCSARSPASYYELQIDTAANKPDIIKEQQVEWEPHHGTRVEIEMEAKYQRGRQSVDDYLQQTAIANPHVTLIYHAPDGRTDSYAATVKTLPPSPKAIRPHPHGIELGVLLKMMGSSKARTLRQFLTSEFSRVSPRVAGEICAKAGVAVDDKPSRLGGDAIKAIYNAIQQMRLMAPATDCVVPIGQDQLIAGLKQVVQAQFYVATSRSPAVYRGNPFIIEAALAYGKPADESPAGPASPADAKEGQAAQPAAAPTTDEEDEQSQQAKLIRFANRVPLLYQQSACAMYKSVVSMNWRQYGIAQSRSALPEGPMTIAIHIASVWVPFTSESKEAIASYPEIFKEIRLALLECGRKLGTHVRKTVRMNEELKKRSYIEKYIPAIGEALRDILKLQTKDVDKVCNDLKHVLERSRKM